MEQTPKPRFHVSEGASVDGMAGKAGVTVIVLEGQLDAHTAPDFERFLEQRVRDGHVINMVLDFQSLDYISSAGLGVLMGLIEEVRSQNGDIKLAALPEKIYHVLDLLGFPMVFQIYPSVAEAVEAFQRA
jgi:anti-sigma B factor antagonist